MEVIEIISSYVNKGNNILRVEYQTINNDNIKSDVIEFHYVEEFGYDVNSTMDVFDDYDMDYDGVETWDDNEERIVY